MPAENNKLILHRCHPYAAFKPVGHNCFVQSALRTAGVLELQHVRRHHGSFTARHKLDDHFTVGTGFQLYIGDWQAPVSREDWIYTPSASVAFNYKKFSAELAYSYDWVENQVPVVPGTATAYADGREYSRHLVSPGLKYSF